MLFKKNTDGFEGFSVLFCCNHVGIDIFIKKPISSSQFLLLMRFYERIDRVSIIPDFQSWGKTLLYFEEKNTEGDYFLLEKIDLKTFAKKGNFLVFNTVPSLLFTLEKNKKIEMFEKLSSFNNDEVVNDINYKEQINIFIKDTLHTKNREVVRFGNILE